MPKIHLTITNNTKSQSRATSARPSESEELFADSVRSIQPSSERDKPVEYQTITVEGSSARSQRSIRSKRNSKRQAKAQMAVNAASSRATPRSKANSRSKQSDASKRQSELLAEYDTIRRRYDRQHDEQTAANEIITVRPQQSEEGARIESNLAALVDKTQRLAAKTGDRQLQGGLMALADNYRNLSGGICKCADKKNHPYLARTVIFRMSL
jgi:hypothetical protein